MWWYSTSKTGDIVCSVQGTYAVGKTHRELFSEFYEDLLQEPLDQALAEQPRPAASVLLFQQMMRDITTAGGVGMDPVGQVSTHDQAHVVYLSVFNGWQGGPLNREGRVKRGGQREKLCNSCVDSLVKSGTEAASIV